VAASLKAIEVYALMHNPMKAIEYMVDMPASKFDVKQIERIEMQWWSIFFMDYSGRSTGKSHNLLLEETVKLPLIPGRSGILLGLDKSIGKELFDEHLVAWLNGTGHLKDFYDVRRSDMEGRIAKQEYGAKAEFNLAHVFKGLPSTPSSLRTMTPDLNRDAKKLQSWRFNFVHFSEWTSFPRPDVMAETIEPIATRTNMMYYNTQKLRERSETHLQRPLGSIDNETYLRAFGLIEGRHPRPHIGTSEKLSITMAIHYFKENFFRTYGFNYDDGIGYEDINFSRLQTEDDLVRFFAKFGRGDEPYANQITYDGSAKRPSDECYIFKKYFSEQTDAGHPAYGEFVCSVEDIDPKFDGIIFDSAIIKKYKDSHLREDYDRVYGGIWVEGYKNKPYDPAAIAKCMSNYFPTLETKPDKEYLIAVDAAKGTEKMRATGGKATKGSGHGDDAGAAVVSIGEGTKENPHKLEFVYIAEDVRKDPMAIEIHGLTDVFQPVILALDPGGGGGDLADSLAKEKLFDARGNLFEPTPRVVHDYQLDDPNVERIVHFVSRANEFIKGVYAKSDSDKATWRGDDALVNKIHEVVSSLFESGGVVVPITRNSFELADLSNSGKLSGSEFDNIHAAQKAVAQINAIRYAIDPRTGARRKTSSGLFQFESPRRKDLAYCVIYALFMADLYVKIKKMSPEEDYIPISRG